MNRLMAIRSQEFLCRERAALDSERRAFWLARHTSSDTQKYEGGSIKSSVEKSLVEPG